MIDTHAHLDSTHYDNDRQSVIDSAFENGLEYIIIPAIEPEGFDKLFQVVNMDDRIFCGIGVHPHNANSVDKYLLQRVESLVSEKKVVAIGEIGLDYFYNFATPEVQKSAFRSQIQIAKKYKLPAIVHNRESDEDLFEILKSEQDGKLNAVLHCFSSSEEFLTKALEIGLHISFTGNVTFKKSNLHEVVKTVPLEKLMLETDSPYMTPVPHRGERNTPEMVKLVAQKIADIKEISVDEVIKMTTQTAKRFFGLLSVLFLLFLPSFAYSQADESIYQEEDEEIYVNPYEKKIGIGFTIGGNTIVESYEPQRPPLPTKLSYEGIMAYGGTIQYGIFDYLLISTTVTYSKNTKLVEEYKVEPTTFTQFELTSHWIANPHGRVNVYAMIGASYLHNQYGKPIGEGWNSFDRPAINGGIGFYFNVPVDGAGLFALSAEWKLNYQIGSMETKYDPRNKEPNALNTTISTFFSIPRVNIMWYPNFLFK